MQDNTQRSAYLTLTPTESSKVVIDDYTRKIGKTLKVALRIEFTKDIPKDSGIGKWTDHTNYDGANFLFAYSGTSNYMIKASELAQNIVTTEAIPADTYWIIGDILLK